MTPRAPDDADERAGLRTFCLVWFARGGIEITQEHRDHGERDQETSERQLAARGNLDLVIRVAVEHEPHAMRLAHRLHPTGRVDTCIDPVEEDPRTRRM